MSSFPMLRRQHRLYRLLSANDGMSKDSIIASLKEEGFEVANRTLEKDFEIIRSEYGIELKYDKRLNGYFIDEEESNRNESFIRFMEMVNLAQIFHENLIQNKKLFEFISFDDSTRFRGVENLQEILRAISHEREIHFKHWNFEKGRDTFYKIFPLLLKEYENRWYALGKEIGGKERTLTFGVDRIHDLKVGDFFSFDKSLVREDIQRFDNIVGIGIEPGDPKEKLDVLLLVDAMHVNYLESLPLHISQRIGKDLGNGKMRVTYNLIPNYEFKTQILKMGDYAEVVEPAFLRNEIIQMLQNTLQNYNRATN